MAVIDSFHSMEKELISFVTSKEGDQVSIHLDKNGLNYLITKLTSLKQKLDLNECDHTHLMSEDWGGFAHSLSATKLQDDPNEDNIVHHVKIYSWNDEWKKKHGLS